MPIRTAAPLSPLMIRRRPPLARALPSAFTDRTDPVPPPAIAWGDDLRFFATCYAAGLLFFLVMLS